MPILHETTSLCSHCKNGIPAQVVADENGHVWLKKKCVDHGAQAVMIASDAKWYEATRSNFSAKPNPPQAKSSLEFGCPFDCGACAQHEQKIRLPVITLNSDCNLDCPICYVHNKNNNAFVMGFDEFKQTIAALQAEYGSGLDVLNVTGGEPTLHPRFIEFLEYAKSVGIHRVTICTNGIHFVKNPESLRSLAAMGARVALSFDSFDAEVDYRMQGARLLKLKYECLDLLQEFGIGTTLIPVITKGVNDHEVGKLIDLCMERPNIRHLEMHLMTYTGQGGKSCDRAGRIMLDEVLAQIETQSNGWLTRDDFVPTPCAHPLCYQVAYLLLDPQGGRPVPFTRFMSRHELYAALSDRLYLEPTAELERVLREAIDRLWVEDSEESQRVLFALKKLMTDLFPTNHALSREEQLLIGERAVKAIYIHSHMDEENFDVERVLQCCDSNCYPDGTSIPVCAYNVLYREKEPRFMENPLKWNERRGGLIHDHTQTT